VGTRRRRSCGCGRPCRAELRPELLNRIDEIVVFHSLGREELARIVEIQLGRLSKLLSDKQLKLELTDRAKQAVGKAGYDPVYGARPLKRALQRLVLDPLAMKVLQGRFQARRHRARGRERVGRRALVLARKMGPGAPSDQPRCTRPGRLLEGTEPRLGEVGRQLTRRGGIPATRSAGSPCCTPCHASLSLW